MRTSGLAGPRLTTDVMRQHIFRIEYALIAALIAVAAIARFYTGRHRPQQHLQLRRQPVVGACRTRSLGPALAGAHREAPR